MYLKEAVENEIMGWEQIKKLKEVNLQSLRSGVAVGSVAEVFERSVSSVKRILFELTTGGMSFSNADPGHALGHFVRDYLNAIRLAAKLSADPKDLFIGILGGTFHDIGCAFINRYNEPTQLIRHAEAGALILEQVFKLNSCGLNRNEQLLVEYSIAAHTHYLKPMELKFHGDTYLIEPYHDEEDGKPILAVYFPRWVDRLECNGPTFVGRHYLTLAEPHKDFSGEEYFKVKFADHLRPLLRSTEEIRAGGGQTMLEHLDMFMKSQTNSSPYGKYDYGVMVEMRDRQTVRLNRIIAACNIAFNGDRETVFSDWNLFLTKNIEPTESGAKAVVTLSNAFLGLPEVIRNAWTSCFAATLSEYRDWEIEALIDIKQMRRQKLSKPEEALSGVIDMLSMISPAYLAPSS